MAEFFFEVVVGAVFDFVGDLFFQGVEALFDRRKHDDS